MENLRARGIILTAFGEKLLKDKQIRIAGVFRQMLIMPLAFSAGFVLLMIFIMQMARKDVLKPLSLLQAAAENAGKGMLNPIGQVIQKKNEVSQCIVAFNKMVEVRLETPLILDFKIQYCIPPPSPRLGY